MYTSRPTGPSAQTHINYAPEVAADVNFRFSTALHARLQQIPSRLEVGLPVRFEVLNRTFGAWILFSVYNGALLHPLFFFFFFVNGAVWESTRLIKIYDEVFVVTY